MKGAGGGFRSTNCRELGLVSRSLPSRLAVPTGADDAEVGQRGSSYSEANR